MEGEAHMKRGHEGRGRIGHEKTGWGVARRIDG